MTLHGTLSRRATQPDRSAASISIVQQSRNIVVRWGVGIVAVAVMLFSSIRVEFVAAQTSSSQRHGFTSKPLGGSAPEIAWVRQVSTNANQGYEWSTESVFDVQGNSYVTGGSLGLGTAEDFSTIKFGTNGEILWHHRYDGGARAFDRATSIAVHPNGSIIVSGLITRADGTIAYATIALDRETGEEKWSKNFRRIGLFYYTAETAIDAEGNIVVVGTRFLSYSSGVFLWSAVSYDELGEERWTREIDSCGHIAKVLVDPQGNSYLIGQSAEFGYRSRVVKCDRYGSVVYDQLFEQQLYDGQPDSSGKLLVTGGTTENFSSLAFVARLDGQGLVEWSSIDSTSPTATSGRALTVDGSGSIHVSSLTVDGQWRVTASVYDTSGHKVWSAYHSDFPTDGGNLTHIALGKAGETYIGVASGYRYYLLRYSAVGEDLGSAVVSGGVYNAGAVAQDGYFYAAGSFFDSASQNYDYGMSKFNPDGSVLNSYRFEDHTNTSDMACGMAIDEGGNILVGGHSHLGDHMSLTLWKLDADGNLLWTSSVPESTNAFLNAVGMAATPGGEAVMIADRYDQSSGDDYLVVRFDSSGEARWRVRYGHFAGANNDRPSALALDAVGNTYVTGMSASSPFSTPNYAFLTMKIDPSGTVLWARRRPDPGSQYPNRVSLRLGGDGGVYVAGTTTGSDGQNDIELVRYDTAGNETWATRYIAGNGSEESVDAIAVDDSSNIVCVGLVSGGRGPGGNPTDFLVTKFGINGQLEWATRTDTTVIDQFHSVGIDHTGAIVAAGRSWPAGNTTDIAVLKYDRAGNVLWTNIPYEFPGIWGDEPTHVGFDGTNNITVLGTTLTGSGARDLALIAYDPEGVTKWVGYFEGLYYGDDAPAGLNVGEDGSILAVETNQSGESSVVSVLKLLPGNISGIEPNPSTTSKTMLELHAQSWPNPFNSSTRIAYYLPADSRIAIAVYNVLGESVARLLDNVESAGNHSLTWSPENLPTGMYFCRFETSKETITLKLFLVR